MLIADIHHVSLNVSDVSRAAAMLEGFESGAPGWIVGNFCTLLCDDWTIWIDALFNQWLNDGSNDVFGNPINYLSQSDTFAVSPFINLCKYLLRRYL